MHDNAPYHYYEYDFWHPTFSSIRDFPVSKTGLNRYSPLLPIEISVSLGEGNTVLLPASEKLMQWCGLTELWIKHEEMNPTGCFKDRESALVISAAKAAGRKSVEIVSSGNAALSTAAYARKANIDCVAYVPRMTSQEKIDLIKFFGATLHTLPGNYEEIYRRVARWDSDSWNVTSGQNYIRTEANKTIAYEIWEQYGAPDVLVVPAGNGGCLAGIWRGFWDLQKLGKINRTPCMVAVQVENAAPLQRALGAGVNIAIVPNAPDSIAEGIVAQESYCSPKAIQAIKESEGLVITVTDEEIMSALGSVVQYESIVAEPTSAAAFAALPKLPPQLKSKRVVCLNTGSGMKMISKLASILASPADTIQLK